MITSSSPYAQLIAKDLHNGQIYTSDSESYSSIQTKLFLMSKITQDKLIFSYQLSDQGPKPAKDVDPLPRTFHWNLSNNKPSREPNQAELDWAVRFFNFIQDRMRDSTDLSGPPSPLTTSPPVQNFKAAVLGTLSTDRFDKEDVQKEDNEDFVVCTLGSEANEGETDLTTKSVTQKENQSLCTIS